MSSIQSRWRLRCIAQFPDPPSGSCQMAAMDRSSWTLRLSLYVQLLPSFEPETQCDPATNPLPNNEKVSAWHPARVLEFLKVPHVWSSFG
jgi:hypothetical protein